MRWFPLRVTKYQCRGPKLKAAVVADLHGQPTKELIETLKAEQPDVILIPGDLCTIGACSGHLIPPEKQEKRLQGQKNALEFLKIAGTIAPVYYSRGNHEWGCNAEYRRKVKAAGAILLENKWVKFGDLWIGGQTPAEYPERDDGRKACTAEKIPPETKWLEHSPEGYKILLCHHPEYYDLVEPFADRIIAGHTHGAQWHFFGKGVFAPGQGLFPRYTRGRYGKMIVSAGLTNTTWVPRLFNPTELVMIELK